MVAVLARGRGLPDARLDGEKLHPKSVRIAMAGSTTCASNREEVLMPVCAK